MANLKASTEPSDELKAFIRAEVRKALAEERAGLCQECVQHLAEQTRRTRGWEPYTPPGLETKRNG